MSMEYEENVEKKSGRFLQGETVFCGGNKYTVAFGPFEKGFFSYYELENSDGFIETIDSKKIYRG
jgi:hypothetical protein